MIISFFNKKINIYPELGISFLDGNTTSENYISGDFFDLDIEVFTNMYIEIYTI